MAAQQQHDVGRRVRADARAAPAGGARPPRPAARRGSRRAAPRGPARRRRRAGRSRAGRRRGSRRARRRRRSPRPPRPWPRARGRHRPATPPGGAPGAGSPSRPTRAPTIRSVADQAQLVVQTVLTTSSKTVGLRRSRPAPRAAQASSGSSATAGVEAAQVVVQAEHAAHRRRQGRRDRRRRRRPRVGDVHGDRRHGGSGAGGDARRRGLRQPHGPRSLRRRQRDGGAATVGVDRHRRQLRHAVRAQRAPQVHRLAAGAEQRDDGHAGHGEVHLRTVPAHDDPATPVIRRR